MSSYEKAKELADALVVTGNWPWFDAQMIDDEGTVCLKRDEKRTWYHPNGLVTVFPMALYKGGPVPVDTVPSGVEYLTYKSPWKQYVVISGNDGVVRYYLMPEIQTYNPNRSSAKLVKLGLTLMPHPEKLYVPVEALPDYEISISRQLKGAAMAKWSDFFEYVSTMWDLLPNGISITDAVRSDVTKRWRAGERPVLGVRNSWYVITQFARLDWWSKADVRAAIGAYVMLDDLPYNVKRVPAIKSSHTQHWSTQLVKKLGAAGRLDDLPEA